MKKAIIIFSSLFLTITMQAQDRPQPKPGPAPTINIKKPETFTLPNGLKVMIVENHKLPRVSYSLSIDNAPYAEGSKKGVSDLTSSLIGNGSTKTPKDAFNDEIDFLGASIMFRSNGAFASSLSKYSKRVMELLAEGALHPNFTQEELDKEKAILIEGLKSEEKSVSAVSARVTSALAFGRNHPSGEYLTENSINNVTLDDVKANYRTYFVPANAYLVITGDVNVKDAKKMAKKLFGSWVKGSAPDVTYTDPANVQYTQINFVDMPNAVQSEISIVNTTKLKMSDPDFFPVMLANQVVGGDFNSYLNMNLREAHGWTYGARSSISASRYVSAFKSSSQVRNSVTDSAVVEFVKELKRIRTEKVDPTVLANVKAGYIGNFVMQVDKPQTIARFALNIETEKLPADFYTNYIKSINAVTPEDIQRVANKYFMADNSRIIVVGKGADIFGPLEKLGIPMFYFDKYGDPVEKPVFKKPVPAGTTVKTVMDNYIKAIGGEKAAKAVKTVYTKASGVIQGTPLEMTTKVSSAGKMMVDITAMGMSMMKQVVGDKSGYMTQQGQRKDTEAADFADQKAGAVPFEELTLASKKDITLDGIESLNGADAYVVKNGKSTSYYDVNTGLKLAEATTMDAGGKSVTQTRTLSDYRDVKGVKIPFKTVLDVGMELEFNVTEAKINEGVSDADFN